MGYVPKIDELACAAHGDCAMLAPQVFAIDDIATVISAGPSDLILEAARACPATAIAVYDSETGDQVYP